MFRRKKDEKSEYEEKIDDLEEMYWFLCKEIVRIEGGYPTDTNVANVIQWEKNSEKDKTSINDAQKEKIQLVIFSSIEDLIHDEILNKEYVERKYGDVFAMSKGISNRIIRTLEGEK